MRNDEISLQNLYEGILNNRTEIRNLIEASEARLLMKLEEANRKILKLEVNLNLKNKAESLDRVISRNNVAVFGLEKPQNSAINYMKGIEQYLQYFRLGKSEKCRN